MKNFLLDSDICVALIRNHQNVKKKLSVISSERCFISEITVAELRFGAESSGRREREHGIVDLICEKYTVLPISDAIRTFAIEKARLCSIGRKIPDFDMLIGATALYHELVLVTNNTKHFERMENIQLENWMQ